MFASNPKFVRLMADLATAGYVFDSITGLRTSGTRYASAIPILIAALDPDDPDFNFQEEVVRCLSVPWARADLPDLLAMFEKIPKTGTASELLRWAVGSAIEVVWDDRYLDRLSDVAADRRYGRAREMIVMGLSKSKHKEKVHQLLLNLVNDPDIDGNAITALSKVVTRGSQDKAAASVFNRASEDKRTWVRRAAAKGLARMEPGVV